MGYLHVKCTDSVTLRIRSRSSFVPTGGALRNGGLPFAGRARTASDASSRSAERARATLPREVGNPAAVKDERTAVLVHRSDGWDYTAQATFLLDPFFQTLTGFMTGPHKGVPGEHRSHHPQMDAARRRVSATAAITDYMKCKDEIQKLLGGPLPDEISILSKMVANLTSCSKSPVLHTPQDSENEPSALLVSGTIAMESVRPGQLRERKDLPVPDGNSTATSESTQSDIPAGNVHHH